MWPMPEALHSFATSTIESAALGAKHEVVVTIHTMLSAPSRVISRWMAAMSVWSSASSKTLGKGTTSRLADTMAFRHVFWSIRGHSTYLLMHTSFHVQMMVCPTGYATHTWW